MPLTLNQTWYVLTRNKFTINDQIFDHIALNLFLISITDFLYSYSCLLSIYFCMSSLCFSNISRTILHCSVASFKRLILVYRSIRSYRNLLLVSIFAFWGINLDSFFMTLLPLLQHFLYVYSISFYKVFKSDRKYYKAYLSNELRRLFSMIFWINKDLSLV